MFGLGLGLVLGLTIVNYFIDPLVLLLSSISVTPGYDNLNTFHV